MTKNASKNYIFEEESTNSFIEINADDKIKKDDNGLFEKKKLQWLKIKEYKTNNDILPLRPWYKPILDSVTKNEKFLLKEINNLKNEKFK